MPDVKIILVERPWNYRNKHAEHIFQSQITDWEQISECEYKDLVKNLKYLPEPLYNCTYQIIVKDALPALKRLSELQAGIDQRKAEEEEREQRKKESAKKRAEAAKRKKEREEKKVLEELKIKYGL